MKFKKRTTFLCFMISLSLHIILLFLLCKNQKTVGLLVNGKTVSTLSLNIEHKLISNPPRYIMTKATTPSKPPKSFPLKPYINSKNILSSSEAMDTPNNNDFIEPTLISDISPHYPRKSRLRHEEGSVLLDVEFLAIGLIGEILILQPSSFSNLDAAALEAAKQIRFIPAKRGSEAVSFRKKLRITFKLNG